MLKTIYSKLVLILGMMLGFALLYISALKRVALEKELREMNKRLRANSEAQKAMLEGLEREGTPVKRGHFDK